jgi:hypothetical protein
VPLGAVNRTTAAAYWSAARRSHNAIQFGRARFPISGELTSVRAFPSFRRAGRKPPAISHDGGRSVARPKTQRRRLFGDRARGDSESDTGRYLDLSVRYRQRGTKFSQTTAYRKERSWNVAKSGGPDPVCRVTSEVSIRQQSIVLKLCQNSKSFAWNGLCLERKQVP